MVVAVDAGGMAIREADLNGVVAYHRGGLGAWLGLEHGQRGRRFEGRIYVAERGFLLASVVAGGAGAFVAEIGEFVVAGVAVGPDNIHTGAVLDVNLDAGWFFSW